VFWAFPDLTKTTNQNPIFPAAKNAKEKDARNRSAEIPHFPPKNTVCITVSQKPLKFNHKLAY
jgi:hypothetical protein